MSSLRLLKKIRVAGLRLGLVFAATSASAAPPPAKGPQPAYVYPAGARRGQTLKVVVGGRQLQGVQEAVISGGGVTARVLAHERPLRPEERNRMKEELAELKKSGASPAPGRVAELESRLASRSGGALPPALPEAVTLELSVAPDAEPGRRDLRLRARDGLAAPLVFVVGDLPELSFPAVTAITPRPEPGSLRALAQAAGAELRVTPPVMVNGQILAGESDRVRFAGKAGARLVVAVHARALIPYLADAVPGWFQATASLLDAAGRELAFADDFRFQPDPVLAFRLPADGDYTLVLRDALYRGREDFVYRVAIGELPFVAGVFPLGGRAGAEQEFALNGWNLPAPRRLARLPEDVGVVPLELGPCLAATGEVEVEADDLPEWRETADGVGAQPIDVPAVVNGRIERPGDVDEISFYAEAGASLVVEVVARRLRSPLDGVLQVFGPDGKVVATSDDCEDKSDGISTHHADPRVAFVAPAEGRHRVRLGDAQGRGGHDYAYRLKVAPPRPDFELRAVPSSVNLRPGGKTSVTVYALRRDGFKGPITLTLKDTPPWLRLASAFVPADADKAEITLLASGQAGTEVAALHLEGAAMVDGVERRHRVVPAEDRMQAFFYRHLVPAREWTLAVRGREK